MGPLATKEERYPLSRQISIWERDRALFQRKLFEFDDVEIPTENYMSCNEEPSSLGGGKCYHAFIETAEHETLWNHRYGTGNETPKGLESCPSPLDAVAGGGSAAIGSLTRSFAQQLARKEAAKLAAKTAAAATVEEAIGVPIPTRLTRRAYAESEEYVDSVPSLGYHGWSAPKELGPDDMIPNGISFDIAKPKYRQFKSGNDILEYTLDGGEITVDWVSGKNACSMMKAILDADEAGVKRISSYVTDKLGGASNAAPQRLGNQMAGQMGAGWKVTIEMIEGRRYLVFTK